MLIVSLYEDIIPAGVRTLLKRVAANVKVIHSTSNPLGYVVLFPDRSVLFPLDRFSVAPDGGLCIPYTTAPEHLAQFLTQYVSVCCPLFVYVTFFADTWRGSPTLRRHRACLRVCSGA